MPRYYVKKPNGKWNIYSSVIDEYIVEDLTLEELKAFRLEEIKEELNKDLDSLLTKKPRVNVMTYKEAENRIKFFHSDE